MEAIFDSLGFYKKLTSAGVPEKQAKIQADTFREFVERTENNLATKADLNRDLKTLETAMKQDMKELEARLKYELTIRLGGITVAAVSISTAVISLMR